jgi:hypothetical protein
MPLARATVTGPGHVIIDVDPEMETVCCRPLLGLPLREAFPEPHFQPILALYDIARELGTPLSVAATASCGEDGVLTLTPRYDAIEIEWWPLPSGLARPPTPHPLALVG